MVAKATDKKIHSFQLSFALQPLAAFTLEMDAGYPTLAALNLVDLLRINSWLPLQEVSVKNNQMNRFDGKSFPYNTLEW